MILQIREVFGGYGTSQVLHGVSLEVDEGEVVALLGRNGAGKTTTLRTVMGLNRPTRGHILFGQDEITGKEPFEIAGFGIGYVPDDRRIFPDLTVEENLEIGRRAPGSQRGPWSLERVYQLFPRLKELRTKRGTQLSGGEQKMLAIGRALMKNPRLLLLDEPAEGLAPLVVRHLLEVLREVRATGVSMLIADQNLKFCRRVADRAYIIEKGLIRHVGSIEAILGNQEVIRRYLAV